MSGLRFGSFGRGKNRQEAIQAIYHRAMKGDFLEIRVLSNPGVF